MKRKVMSFIKSLGGTASYAGNTEKWSLNADEKSYSIARNKATMFINDPTGTIESAVLNEFGMGLPFALKTN